MKRLLAVILAVILMIVPLCVGAVASEDTTSESVVMPRYTTINSISSGISKGLLGFVDCTSNFVSFETDKTFVLTCYLQRTDEDSGWSNYKSKSETFSGDGLSFSIDKSWFAPAGYAYRTYTKLQVKNSAGTVVETATIASSVIYK